VLLVNAIDRLNLELLLDRYGLQLHLVAPEEVIPGSYWGEREAGLIGATIFSRLDTPLHSVLHESAHYVCMTPERRAGLDTDAGGVAAGRRAGTHVPRYGRLGLHFQTGQRRGLVRRRRRRLTRVVDRQRPS
jgi:hypothetical protein